MLASKFKLRYTYKKHETSKQKMFMHKLTKFSVSAERGLTKLIF